MQGMIAEYERAKIQERSRRGKLHAAHSGSVSVMSKAPYGYRYITKQDGGGQARYDVVPEEAHVVRKIFEWVSLEGCSLREVCRRLKRQGTLTRTGNSTWEPTTIGTMLKNSSYKGTASYNKTKSGPRRPAPLRPQRG